MKEYQQFKAKTVDEAVMKAMEELQTSTDFLEYEVVDAGSNGFLGIGARHAVINARKKEDPLTETKSEAKVFEKPVKKEKPTKEKTPHKEEKTCPVSEKKKEDDTEGSYASDAADEEKEFKPAKEIKPIDVTLVIPKAEKFLKDVFDAMKIEAVIDVQAGEEINTIDIDISGEEMGVLIGKRGQTLDSLQYLTSIIVNAGQGEYIRVKVDTENYRSRRKETLENLAHNIASKVKKTNKTVALEPMNPYERRVIHSALQQDKYVDTHSEGEEPYRKVVVTPNKNCRNYGSRGYGNKRYHRTSHK